MKIMSQENKLSDADIRKLVGGDHTESVATKIEVAVTNKPIMEGNIMSTTRIDDTMVTDTIIRKILVIGCGDGGSSIADMIKVKIPSTTAIAYNTSSRAADKINVDALIIPAAEDGSGKDRQYSKNVFKEGPYKRTLQAVNAFIEGEQKVEGLAYIVITTTCDGGTGGGVSPNVAKFISDNVSLPVIVVGVYPRLTEDDQAQLNAIHWQVDIEKTGLPYMIFDNDRCAEASKVLYHKKVNNDIVNCMEVLTGVAFGDSKIQIDNRDMLNLMYNIGDRISICVSDQKLRVNQSLDDYFLETFAASTVLTPENATGYGVFVKGPKSMIDNVDSSLSTLMSKFGNGLCYTHLEESNETKIALIASGSSLPTDRLTVMRERYDDITSSRKSSNVSASSFMEGMETSLVNKLGAKQTKSEVDMSALDV